MQFGVLGPLEVRDDDGNLVELGGRQPRVLVAALLLWSGRPVPVEAITVAPTTTSTTVAEPTTTTTEAPTTSTTQASDQQDPANPQDPTGPQDPTEPQDPATTVPPAPTSTVAGGSDDGAGGTQVLAESQSSVTVLGSVEADSQEGRTLPVTGTPVRTVLTMGGGLLLVGGALLLLAKRREAAAVE